MMRMLSAGGQPQQQPGGRQHSQEEEEDEAGLPDSIKLGLGDFIFYSMLVGRAAMYDLLTATAAYLAIIAGPHAPLVPVLACAHA